MKQFFGFLLAALLGGIAVLFSKRSKPLGTTATKLAIKTTKVEAKRKVEAVKAEVKVEAEKSTESIQEKVNDALHSDDPNDDGLMDNF